MANFVKIRTDEGFKEISYTRIADSVQFARVSCSEGSSQPVLLTVQGPTKTRMFTVSESYIGLWDSNNSKWIWQIDVPVYPVGAVYMSSSSTSPASLFGGTWAPIQNRFLIGAGADYQTMKTGGESSHKLTTSEIPAHTHNIGVDYDGEGSGTTNGAATVHKAGTSGAQHQVKTSSVGSTSAHNNMPPWYGVYMWRRTA